MIPSRITLIALGASALLSVASLALACGDKNQPCACGAAAAAAAAEKGDAAPAMPCAEGGCACQKAAEAAAAEPKADAPVVQAAPAAVAGAQQKAFIDPATGRLISPKDARAIEQPPAAGIPPASTAAVPAPVQVVQPDGGVVAAFPADRAPKVVATIDDHGKAHTGCAE